MTRASAARSTGRSTSIRAPVGRLRSRWGRSSIPSGQLALEYMAGRSARITSAFGAVGLACASVWSCALVSGVDQLQEVTCVEACDAAADAPTVAQDGSSATGDAQDGSSATGDAQDGSNAT